MDARREPHERPQPKEMDVAQIRPDADRTIIQLHYKERIQNHPNTAMQTNGIPQDHGEPRLLPCPANTILCQTLAPVALLQDIRHCVALDHGGPSPSGSGGAKYNKTPTTASAPAGSLKRQSTHSLRVHKSR